MAPPKPHRLSCEQIEELLPELLYGELDDEREADVRARLPECELEEKVAGYERLRSLLRELPDEEPPPAISAQLMHAAAKQVEGKRVEADAPGFWQRVRDWFGPLGLHPALGAAATLVLVAGAASLLYLRGADHAVGPDVATRAAPPRGEAVDMPAEVTATPRPGAVAAPAGAKDLEQASDFDGDAFGIVGSNAEPRGPQAAAPAADDAVVSRGGDGKGRASRDRGRAANRDKAAKGGKLDVASGGGGLLDGLGNEGGAGSGYRYDSGGSAGTSSGELQKKEQAPLAEAEEEAPPADPPEAKPSSPPPPPDAVKARKTKKKAPSSATLKRIHAEAVQAAQAGDCARVRSLGAQIEKLDGVYYRDVFRRDSAIRACDAARK